MSGRSFPYKISAMHNNLQRRVITPNPAQDRLCKQGSPDLAIVLQHWASSRIAQGSMVTCRVLQAPDLHCPSSQLLSCCLKLGSILIGAG
ncbi:hypothetical protein TIFTF001_047841 [Ficus carica]|uniref:Uncharacterized protein n=1 Tax=Ficus carica TaxID=3494 RepID=A0AA87Z8X0_FICCA|nr:hypothetical protein TIFTF001_047841 [Ficus carica]